ncbi:unnamed protein product [Cunninghamella blakesleeana]
MLLNTIKQLKSKPIYNGMINKTITTRWFTYDITSDTATKPTDDMFDLMKSASKADDVFGMDTSTNNLENHVAQLFGHESSLFCASGSMTNQLGLRLHLKQPPHSVLVDVRSHVNLYECGGLAYHSQASMTAVQPSNGTFLSVQDIQKHAIQDDLCGAITKVVSIENTLNGTIMPLQEMKEISDYCKKMGYKLHMDGARIWEASEATGHSLKEYGQLCDTISVCVSKGIGAPIGSLIVSNHQDIIKARHLRKLMGGGWRQSGGLAIAAHYCLDQVIPQLKTVHQRTQRLWEGLKKLGMTTALPVETNMIFIDTCGIISLKRWSQVLLKEANILIDSSDDRVARIVLHYQIPDSMVDQMLYVTEKLIKEEGKEPVSDNTTSDISNAYPSAPKNDQ